MRLVLTVTGLLFLLNACATHDSELQTARMLEPGAYTYTFAYQYLAEHDEDIWKKRRKSDFSEDYNASSIASGANVLIRRGFTKYMDMGLNASVGKSSLEMRFALFNGERFASALGGKWVLPTFAIEAPFLYRYKVVWYNSYELLPNFAVYAAPHIEWKPHGYLKKEYRGLSAGLVVGKDSGVIVEASYAKAVKGDDPLTYERFSIGYVTGLDKLQGRLRFDPKSEYIKILGSFGSSVFPTPSFGLMGRYLTKNTLNYEASIDLGIGPIPNLGVTKVGLMTSRFFAVRALYSVKEPHTFKFGLARRELRGDFQLDSGWNHLATYNHGIDLSWEHKISDWYITWVGLYVPLPLLPHKHSLKAGPFGPPAPEEMQDLAELWELRPSMTLLNLHKEF